MTLLDFGSVAIKKCCNQLSREISRYHNYWLENNKLIVEIEYEDDGEIYFEEYELEECPSCEKPILYYKTIGMLKRKEYT